MNVIRDVVAKQKLEKDSKLPTIEEIRSRTKNWGKNEREIMRMWKRAELSDLVYENHNRIVSDGETEEFLKSVAKATNLETGRNIEKEEFLIFGSERQWKKMRGIVVLMNDATFKCASLLFNQLLIVSHIRQTPSGDEFLVPLFLVSRIDRF